jgi:hypothetical protein
MKVTEISVLETVLDALECRIAYAIQVEEDMEKAAIVMAVLTSLKERAKEEGLTLAEDEPHMVKGASA